MSLADELRSLADEVETLEAARDDAVKDADLAQEREEELRCAALALDDALSAFLGIERPDCSYEESAVHRALCDLRAVLHAGPDVGYLTRRLNELRKGRLRLVAHG